MKLDCEGHRSSEGNPCHQEMESRVQDPLSLLPSSPLHQLLRAGMPWQKGPGLRARKKEPSSLVSATSQLLCRIGSLGGERERQQRLASSGGREARPRDLGKSAKARERGTAFVARSILLTSLLWYSFLSKLFLPPSLPVSCGLF